MSRIQRVLVIMLMILGGGILTTSRPPASFAQQPTPASPKPNAAQDPKAPAPTSSPQSNQEIVRISTQLVQVDAVVTDKKNRHVEDLTEDDFELLVDGKKQTLTHFSHINLPGKIGRELAQKKKSDPKALESMPTRQIDASEVRRTIAFIVDDLGLSFQSTEMTRETLRKFVAEQMQEGDLVAIIRTGNGLGMLEQFTSDKRLLYSAIEKLIWNPLARDMNPTFADSSVELTDDEQDRQAVLDQFDEFRETSFAMGTLGSISFVVESLRSLPGRKSVILLSDGFKIMSKSNDDNSTIQLQQQLQNLAEMAGRSSVVLYAIDAKGLQPFMPGPSVGGRPSASSYTDALDTAQAALEGPTYLAKQTGGFVVTNTNDLSIGVQEALYDQQSYYLLGFDPDDATFDQKFHKIKINLKRPGLTLRTRSGFFGAAEMDPPPAPTTRGQQLLAALLSPLGKHELPLQMTPYFFNPAKGGPLIRTLFHIDCSKLQFTDGANGEKLLNLDLAAFAFDEKGATADMTANRIKLNLGPQQYKEALQYGLAYRRDFPLKKPGAYQFRAVLRDDASGMTGSASHFIQIPDLSKKRLAMSGLVLTTPKPAPNEAAGPAPTTDVQAFHPASAEQSGKPEETAASALASSPYVRRFPGTGWIQYGAAIYNAETDKKTNLSQITVQAEIYRDGKRLYRFPVRKADPPSGGSAKRFDFVGRLRMNNFPAGQYQLRLTAVDALANKRYARAEQWMDFTVQ